MPETWLELARNSRISANVLVAQKQNRSAVSRAYYAAYSKVVMELLDYGIVMARDREGPSHKKLRPLIESNFLKMASERRFALSRIIGRLYTMRVHADYFPSTTVESREGREAIALMNKVFDAF